MSEEEAREQFSILYKSAQGKSLEVWLKELLSSPQIYSFTEYATWPKVQAHIASQEGEQYRKLLDLFMYGRYSDYEAQKVKLPELSQKMLFKLRLLTLLSLFEYSRVGPT